MQGGTVALLILVTITRLTLAINDFSESDAISLLQRYGYIAETNSSSSLSSASTDLTSALIAFQERYNLPVDGILNEETISLLRKTRCVQGDNSYSVHSTSWRKMNLNWFFPQATAEALLVAKRVFDVFETSSKFKFTYLKLVTSTLKPDITITFVSKHHYFRYNCQGTKLCPSIFTPGQLAHAYFPQENGCIEIHIDKNLSWDFNLNTTAEDQVSFFNVLLHELGHALGLGHSSDPKSIMYPWYQTTLRNLSEDDIAGLEALYGSKSKYAPIPKSSLNSLPITSRTTLSTTNGPLRTSTLSTMKQMVIRNICELEYPDIIFLAYSPSFPNYRMYIVSSNLIWKYDLRDHRIPVNAENFAEYFPRGLSNVSHVYQNSAGDLVGVSANRIYTTAFPSMQIYQDNLVPEVNNAKIINALFQTNSGKNYVFYNNDSFIEFNYGNVVTRGRISDVFPGVSNELSSAFNFIDGHIYFLKKNSYYKYNEFSKSVVEKGTFNWNMIGIPCPDEGLIKQLKTLLFKVNAFYE